MAVGNSLTKPQPKADRVEFEVAGETIVLTPQTVRDYLVSGDKERVTMQEVVMFINLCKYAGLNPWLKERPESLAARGVLHQVWERTGHDGRRQRSVYEAGRKNTGI